MPAAAKTTSPRSQRNTSARAPRAAEAAEARLRRYREAERALWDIYELEPVERFLELGSPAVGLRVQEIGSGEPVLFVHGTGGPGTWPSLVRELEGVRCILLDRPGWGLSSPVDYSATDYNALVAELLRGVLDALGDRREVERVAQSQDGLDDGALVGAGRHARDE